MNVVQVIGHFGLCSKYSVLKFKNRRTSQSRWELYWLLVRRSDNNWSYPMSLLPECKIEPRCPHMLEMFSDHNTPVEVMDILRFLMLFICLLLCSPTNGPVTAVLWKLNCRGF